MPEGIGVRGQTEGALLLTHALCYRERVDERQSAIWACQPERRCPTCALREQDNAQVGHLRSERLKAGPAIAITRSEAGS